MEPASVGIPYSQTVTDASDREQKRISNVHPTVLSHPKNSRPAIKRTRRHPPMGTLAWLSSSAPLNPSAGELE